MSSDDRPLTERDIEPLLRALGRFFDESSPALQTLFDQTRANSLVCAFLLRELTKAGLVDAKAIKQEALGIADSYDPPGSGAGVAGHIKSIFGGQPPEIPQQVLLRVIQGGLDRAGLQQGGLSQDGNGIIAGSKRPAGLKEPREPSA